MFSHGYYYLELRTLHNEKEANPRKGYNNRKYLSTYVTGVPIYIKQLLMDIEGEIYSNTILVGDFNTPLASMDSLSSQKINMEIMSH